MNESERWLEIKFEEVEPVDFYRGIFGHGELDANDAKTKGKYTGIIVAMSKEKKPDGRPITKRWTLTDDLDAVREAVASDLFCVTSPLSYVGKKRHAEHARELYAIAVDVDRLRYDKDGEPIGVENLFMRHIGSVKRIPCPTYTVSSGNGIHLYYVFDKPIQLYDEVAKALQRFKRELTRLIWHDTIVDIKDARDVQQEGIYQGFRMPGTVTKNGGRARAFKTGEVVTMEYLNSFMDEQYKVYGYTSKRHDGLTLEQAKERYPDWYERRVVNKEPRGVWHVNRALYEWWLEKIKAGAVVGHRYFCVMMLAIYAKKCSFYDAEKNPNPVTLEELEKDAYSLIDRFDAMSRTDDNRFGVDDVQDALEAFNDRWAVYPRSAIEYKSGIIIPATKRNGRKQAVHLRRARAVQEIDFPNGEWRKWGGRPSKESTVLLWRAAHPDGSKAECMADTGLSRSTVFKYWGAWENDD